jgi:four helix bundle protein
MCVPHPGLYLARMDFQVPDDPPEVIFPFERLHAYQAACAYLALIDPLVRSKRAGTPEMRDQLHRSGLSLKLNIAEAAGEFSKPDKIRIFRIASRSGGESAATLDEFKRWGSVDDLMNRKARYTLNAAVGMITRLIIKVKP